jgi:hypothetical protein
MSKPKGQKINRLCRWLSSQSENHPIWWELIRGVLSIVPTGILGLIAFRFEENKIPWVVQEVRHFLQDSPVVLASIIFVPSLINLGLSLALRRALSLEKGRLDGPELMTVLTSINKFVAQKLRRFGTLAADLERKPLEERRKADIFEAITQPQAQILEILVQIHLVLQVLTKDESLKVVLVELNCDPRLEPRYECCSPVDKPPASALLKDLWKKSFFSEVAKADSPKTISDLKKEMKKSAKTRQAFAPTRNDKEYEGSIIGYPLYNPFLERVTHVLTIRSADTDRMNNKFDRKYSKCLEFFFTRIHLEHSLKLIKYAST